MHQLKLRTKLWGAFGLLILAAIVIGGLGLQGMRRRQEVLNRLLAERWAKVRESEEAMAMVNANLRSRLQLFLAPDMATVQRLLAAQRAQSDRITAYYGRLQAKLRTPEERALFDTIVARRRAYLGSFNPARDLILQGERARAATLVNAEVVPRLEDYLAAWSAFVDYQRSQVDAAAQESDRGYRVARGFIIAAMLVTVLAAVLVASVVGRSITAPLATMEAAAREVARGDLTRSPQYRSSDELGALAEAFRSMTSNLRSLLADLDRAASEVASTASELAASAEEVSASADGVAASAQSIADASSTQTQSVTRLVEAAARATEHASQVAAQAEQVRDVMHEVAQSVQAGRSAAGEGLRSMGAITASTREAVPMVLALIEKSEEASGIVNTIAALARQSNLLALNAAIEAARAGEHGRGFAVVADEVKKLADETSRALKTVRELVLQMREIAEQTNERVHAVDVSVTEGESVIRATSERFGEIDARVAASRAATDEIVELAARQRHEADVLAQEVSAMASAAEANAAAAQEVSAVAEEQTSSMAHITASSQSLADLAMRLKDTTARFVV